MKQFLKMNLQDCSNSENFRYTIQCAECETVWKSVPIRFSKAGAGQLSEAKRIIIETLYKREHAQSMDRAAGEAVHHFNICPICGRLVCNYCFVICDDLDMCRSCAASLQETGESVMEHPAALSDNA